MGCRISVVAHNTALKVRRRKEAGSRGCDAQSLALAWEEGLVPRQVLQHLEGMLPLVHWHLHT